VALPIAKTHLDQPRIGAISVRREPHRGPHPLHGLARAPHRAGDEIEFVGARHQLREFAAVAVGLLAPVFGDVGLGLALQPAFGVPGGLAVADEIDDRARHR
jgi:hypothetical protein